MNLDYLGMKAFTPLRTDAPIYEMSFTQPSSFV